MKPISEELLEALRSIRGGCAHWTEGDERISELLKLELIIWASNRPRYEGDPRSGPGWVLSMAGFAYLAGYEHGGRNAREGKS